ncbi:hypothetical protein [Peloplasma aerotolerans]|uniref:FeoB-associated Cys-rich membrane protein n=1 Tax=Peloplasma aerotolerans TaxID=3044389 RepID=A0AAW6U593_9MOLU|nr:hypothetical protein [Mariniplasma sp. M4Ah]MDI6453141.1 hypothetical protein [Mariniplasma sp. M4Ah]
MTAADIVIVIVIGLMVGLIVFRMVVRKDDDICSRCAYAKSCVDECSTKKKTTLS